jgi:hypothetical protein
MVDDKELEQLSEGYAVSFNQVKTTLKFGGKSLEQWCTLFNFVVPEQTDFMDLVELNKKIDDLQSTAHNNYGIAWATYSLLKRGRDKKAVKSYSTMMASVAKRPSVAEGENRIASDCLDEDDKLAVAKAFVDFWEEQIKLLDKRAKIAENLFWSLRNHKEVTE